MGVSIEMPQMLMDRAQASYKVMCEASQHSNKHGIAEGLMVLMIATEFAGKQYGIPAKEMRDASKRIRNMIERAQQFTGDQCGVAEIVTEMGLS